MLIKAGVDISRIRLELRKKLTIIDRIMMAIEDEELVITSTYEGNHFPSSRHYDHSAIDIRKFEKPTMVVADLVKQLGPDFYVYLAKTHIHIGYTKP